MINGKKYGLFGVLKKRFSAMPLESNFLLARHTTIGCGGAASAAAYPREKEEARSLVAFLERERIPYFALGAGANVLPSDDDFEGVVVKLNLLSAVTRRKDALIAGAGVTGGALIRFARGELLSGFEPFTGMPTTVGGGICMNAGVSARHFSDLAESVTAVINGELVELSGKECLFSEKKSVFTESGAIVLEAKLRAVPSTKEKIARELCYFKARRAHLPKGRSMGCTFVNPEGVSAGALVEQCGLKGFAIGGARVSEIHANFIVNEGGSAADVGALVDKMKRTVYEKTGVILREEIRRLPPYHKVIT